MQSEFFSIKGPVKLKPACFTDDRGYFFESFNAEAFAKIIPDTVFVQDNESFSAAKGTIRGLHRQISPFAQAKLVRVVNGRIFDVAIDVRPGSPTFGQHVAVILSAENKEQLFIPEGFLHGFCTLEPNSTVIYKVNAFYNKAAERPVRFDDPFFKINWPVSSKEAVLSLKDREAPFFEDLPEQTGTQSADKEF